MKKFAAIIFTVVILIISVFCLNASAMGEFAVASVHFDAVVNADGTVAVTETWDIEYSETGDGFIRSIDLYNSKNSNNMATIEKFESIDDVAVSINGKPVSSTKTGNDSFRIGTSSDGRSFNIEIDSPSAAETKEYVVTYTLSGAVKKNGSNAEFAYVFLGESFEFVSNNVSATVTFPDGTTTEDIIVADDTALVDKNAVDFAPGRVYDTFRVDVKCSAEVFDSNSLVRYSAFADGMSKAWNIFVDICIWGIIGVAGVVVVIFALFGEKLRRHSLEKAAKKQIADGSAADVTAVPDEITPCQAYKMLNPYSRISPRSSTKKVVPLFAMAILECIENGYIVECDDGLMIGTPAGKVPAYIQSVLNFLKTFSEKKDNRYILDKSFEENIKTECLTAYDNVSNYLATFYSLIPSADGKFFRTQTNKELYKKAYIVKKHIISSGKKADFALCMNNVLAGRATRDEDVSALLFVLGNKAFTAPSTGIAAAFSGALQAMYNIFVKSK